MPRSQPDRTGNSATAAEGARKRTSGAQPRSDGRGCGHGCDFVLFSLMSSFPLAWRGFFRDCLEGAVSGNLRMEALRPFLTHTGLFAATVAALALGWGVALSSALAQGGLVFAPASLMPTASRISPAAKLRTTVLDHGVARADQVAASGCGGHLRRRRLPAPRLAFADGALRRASRAVCWALPQNAFLRLPGSRRSSCCIWSVLDYLFERQHLSSELKMSRQELKDEYKDTEGNPVIKGRIRRLQRQMRRRRMLEETKRASVVITNPTEYAIALEYRPEMPAPVVVAKGRNLLAAQIKEIARWENIPMVENPPLAHALYRTVEIGQSIPAKLYAVIAEILAAVYRAEAAAAAAAVTGGRR